MQSIKSQVGLNLRSLWCVACNLTRNQLAILTTACPNVYQCHPANPVTARVYISAPALTWQCDSKVAHGRRVEDTAGWRVGGLAGWRVGGLAGWRVGGLAGWRAVSGLRFALARSAS